MDGKCVHYVLDERFVIHSCASKNADAYVVRIGVRGDILRGLVGNHLLWMYIFCDAGFFRLKCIVLTKIWSNCQNQTFSLKKATNLNKGHSIFANHDIKNRQVFIILQP